MTRTRHILLAVLLAGILMIPPPASFAKKPEMTEVQAKLALIYNFVSRYLQWPAPYDLASNPDIYICAIGDDEVTKEIEVLTKASTGKLKVHVLLHQPPNHLKECHVVYVATSEKRDAKNIIGIMRGSPVLSLSSIESFAEDGGIIALIRQTEMNGTFEKTYIRYDVNIGSLQSGGLHIDQDALELARKVVK